MNANVSVPFGAAVFARSHADFTSKVAIALEEMEESWRWLRLLRDAMNDPPRDLELVLGAERVGQHWTAPRLRVDG